MATRGEVERLVHEAIRAGYEVRVDERATTSIVAPPSAGGRGVEIYADGIGASAEPGGARRYWTAVEEMARHVGLEGRRSS